MGDNIPKISMLLKHMILGNYMEALDIVEDDSFNPNERTKTWGAPVLVALHTVLSGTTSFDAVPAAKEVFKIIINHKDFDPNLQDDSGETALMHLARTKSFAWLVPFLLNKEGIDIDMKNFMHQTAVDIAQICGNNAIADLILVYKMKSNVKRLPKKMTIRKKKSVASVIPADKKEITKRIENAFDDESKENPFSLYWVLLSFLTGNYDEAVRVASNVHFNPNETDRWEEPALSSLIYYTQDADIVYDENKLKELVKAIINNRRFDVNALDADCNTPLMVAMGFKRLDWLVEELFKFSSARIDIVNDMGENLQEIAKQSNNEELYEKMISRNYETANVVD